MAKQQKKCGEYPVHVVDDDGVGHWFAPGEVYPKWAADKVDNPLAFADGGDPEPYPEIQAAGPPQSGRGSGRDAWADYAFKYGVLVDDDMTRDDIIAACEAAGITV